MNRSNQTATSPRATAARRATARTIGPWQLVRQLGAGAWTEVHQARPVSSMPDGTADYVVKLLKANHEDDPAAIASLQREAFIARQVGHPHLVSVLSAHTHRAPRFIVMPYVAGISAAEILKQAIRFSVPQALWIARQTAEALQALHQQGWLHGDVKPANIIVSASGHATLADLGLAHRFDVPRSSAAALTGTLAYASPETFNPNVRFGPASDGYSLGVTLFEMLTASLPFGDDDPTDLAAAHLIRPMPDPRATAPHLPVRVTRLLRTLLAKDPLRRPTVPELIDWLVDLEVETFPERFSALSHSGCSALDVLWAVSPDPHTSWTEGLPSAT